MKFTLRLVTVICYFLPFTFFLTTCNNGLELRFSYNQAEADKNILLEKESSEAVTDTAQYDQQILNDTTKSNLDFDKAFEFYGLLSDDFKKNASVNASAYAASEDPEFVSISFTFLYPKLLNEFENIIVQLKRNMIKKSDW